MLTDHEYHQYYKYYQYCLTCDKASAMKTVVFLLSFFTAVSGYSQGGGYNKNDFKTVSGSLFLTTITGEPINTNKYIRLVEGTPFFQDGWMQSIIVLKDGKRTQNVQARLNLLEDEIVYLDTKGRELVVTQPVTEIVFMNKTEDSLFRFVHASVLGNPQAKKGWYQWLHSGAASLFRYYQKDLFEQKPYGSASAEQRIATKERYFVLLDDRMHPVKNLRELPVILGDRKGEMEALLKKLPASGSTEEKMIAGITFYNSLVSKRN